MDHPETWVQCTQHETAKTKPCRQWAALHSEHRLVLTAHACLSPLGLPCCCRYRAPECLLTDGYYNYKMDMWGVGCVMFEIVALYPLFPGIGLGRYTVYSRLLESLH